MKRTLFEKIKTIVLDLVFPIECVGCGSAKSFLCDECAGSIPIRTEHVCPICEERPMAYGRVCSDCRGKSALDGLLVASSYQNRIVSKTIHLYKYRFIRELSQPLSRLLLQTVRRSEIPLPDLLCAVPLHPWRLRWRGFNQSELLADALSTKLIPHLDIQITHGLIRSRFTKPQRSVEETAERHANMQGAFEWKPRASKALPESLQTIQGKYIWIIDDVATTSATLDECAKVLKRNGAKKVFGVVLAR